MGPTSLFLTGGSGESSGQGGSGQGLGVLSFLGNAIGGILGNRSRKRESRRQRNWQEKMWHMQNAYNTPKAQMQRFEEAGLNKNLMYGQGNHGNAESVGNYQQPDIQNIPWGDGIGQYMNVQLQQKQLDNVDAQTQNLRQEKLNKILEGQLKLAQGDKTRQEAIVAKHQALYSQEAFRLQNDETAKRIKKIASDIDLNSKQAQKLIADTKLSKADYEWMQKTGLHRHDPMLAKNVKYLKEVTGLSEKEIIFAVGGIIGLKTLLQGAGALFGKIGRTPKPQKNFDKEFKRQDPKKIPFEITNQ